MNLLSPERQRTARIRLALVAWRTLAAYALALVAVSAAFLLIGRTILERHFATVVVQSNLVTRAQEGTFRDIRAANELLLVLDTANERTVPWSALLRSVTDGTPATVTLHRMTLDRANAFHLEGRATVRDGLLAFEQHLRGLPFLTDIAIPFGSFLLRERVEFTMDATFARTAIPRAP